MSNIAYQAVVTMARADWNDETGATVKFKLPMNDSSDRRNPFHNFTKRRKNKAGTIFHMAVAVVEGHDYGDSIFDAEVMLAGWNDSQTSGHTVTFWLHLNDEKMHPFEGISRSEELALVLAEMSDDGEVVDQEKREKVEKPGQHLSVAVAMMCKNEGFWTFCSETYPHEWERHGGDLDPEFVCREIICHQLGIHSRAELDKSSALAEIFHQSIRLPFVEWQKGGSNGAAVL